MPIVQTLCIISHIVFLCQIHPTLSSHERYNARTSVDRKRHPRIPKLSRLNPPLHPPPGHILSLHSMENLIVMLMVRFAFILSTRPSSSSSSSSSSHAAAAAVSAPMLFNQTHSLLLPPLRLYPRHRRRRLGHAVRCARRARPSLHTTAYT